MTYHASRRWFQLSLKSLFLLTLLVATFFAGYTSAMRQADQEERRRGQEEARRQVEEARLQAEKASKEADEAIRSFTW